MSPQYGELQPTSSSDLLVGLTHPCKFQWVLRLGSITTRQSNSGHQRNFAALNRERHLCSAGRPSRWALAHISHCRKSFSRIQLYNILSGLLYAKVVEIPTVTVTSRAVNGYPGVRVPVEQRVPGQ